VENCNRRDGVMRLCFTSLCYDFILLV